MKRDTVTEQTSLQPANLTGGKSLFVRTAVVNNLTYVLSLISLSRSPR